MQTGKSTVKDIFDGTRIFNVPVYQRAYSWQKEDNLKDFLSDIINQPCDRTYFLGSFLFHLNGERNEFSVVDIVDGQQRLTTFVIFINTLINKLLKNGSNIVSSRTKRTYVKDDDVFKLETDNEDSSFLHKVILSDLPSEDRQTVTKSQRLLLDAKAFFESELDKLDLLALEKVYNTAINADVLLYVVDKINSATQIFELLNDRGRKLTDLESIKSFLMYNAGLVSNNPDQTISNIQTDFAEIYRLMERYELSDRDILRYHTIAFEKCPAEMQDKPKEFIKEKFNHLIQENNPRTTLLSEIQQYSTRLKASFKLFARIQDEKDERPELARFFMIGRVAPFYPVLMRIYKEQPEEFDTLLYWLNKFTLQAALVGLRSNGESYLYTRLRNDGDVHELVRSFTQDNWWNINNRAKETIEYHNYYEWLNKNVVRYILFTYENSLRKEKGFPLLGVKTYFAENTREKLSIEHISAQRAKHVEYDDEFYERYMHSIGNLVIDHVASNASKGNKATGDKLPYFNQAPLMSQNQIDAVECDWTDLNSIKAFIAYREEILMAFSRQNFMSDE
ncbi:DUF262 domain-containing HNH endonuclease family protein [Vibrio alginolyticus]|nr:DUF262 domain-containing HNH endonuclease family protein [Vibrio alginolyticus]